MAVLVVHSKGNDPRRSCAWQVLPALLLVASLRVEEPLLP